MQVEITEQHKWLQQLVGRWAFDMSCVMGPDQEPEKSTGAETLIALGGLWVIGEGGGGEGDQAWASRLTLGYDPAQQRFVGTFVASMMTHLWLYNGTLDDAGTTLTLDTEGPNMTDGRMAKYQDLYTITGPDGRTLTSRMLGPDGEWVEFMTATYRRVG